MLKGHLLPCKRWSFAIRPVVHRDVCADDAVAYSFQYTNNMFQFPGFSKGTSYLSGLALLG